MTLPAFSAFAHIEEGFAFFREETRKTSGKSILKTFRLLAFSLGTALFSIPLQKALMEIFVQKTLFSRRGARNSRRFCLKNLRYD